ncbi:Cytochrome P450 monooxygenase lepH [Lachnellula suecica]|uniref:Cytochrome P450 monooxygenase lepH n=1 Tax=Lachnellula suecica TaxID=602035 RepID=A0A8T9BVG6_9HELO|nr:Cytochrome P450 monooxygenase lepH [Lachnellula suecica]
MYLSLSAAMICAMRNYGAPLYLTWRSVSYQFAMRKAGCSSPIKSPHKDPFLGLDLFFKLMKATKAGDSKSVEKHIFAYGKTVQINNWGRKKYMTMDSQIMQAVLTTCADKFGPSPHRHKIGGPFLGDGIFTAPEGEIWKRTRQLITPVFARAQISELSTLEGHCGRMIGLIPRDGSTIDLQPLLRKLYLDSSTEFIFGHSTHSLWPEASNPADQQLPDLFDDALRGLFERAVLGKLRHLSLTGISDKTWLSKCAGVHVIVDSYIDEEIENQKATESTETFSRAPYNYVLLKELVKRTADKIFIRSQ